MPDKRDPTSLTRPARRRIGEARKVGRADGDSRVGAENAGDGEAG